ncbi:F-box/WD repeat-containing protein [Criblamydia sequanensis]|uniref:F-box and WD repeat-containing protein n=1 Tax=Candidatus Criblamydia sequanensis CRIB-18 TaxID=1437425 RepID=A0A090E3M7_9BACT|nr:F-box/WD repeat-containing protein [Criblamydia sequanensis]CDR35164.1 F-box and WD repeat-containing protein [Criblamydia sequanensis CRIB-18]
MNTPISFSAPQTIKDFHISEEKVTINDLPDEIIQKILSSLDFLSLLKAASLCKRWKNIIEDPRALKNRVKEARLTSHQKSQTEERDFSQIEKDFSLRNLTSDFLMRSPKYQPKVAVFEALNGAYGLGFFDDKIAFCNRYDEILILDKQLQKTEKTFDGCIQISFMNILDGKICIGSEDGTIRILDAESGKELKKLEGHELYVSFLQCVDGKIYSGSWDKTIRIWDAESGRELKKLEGHTTSVSFLQILENKIYSASEEDGTIIVWNAETGEKLKTLKIPSSFFSDSIRISDGKIYAGFSDGTIKIFDAESGQELMQLEGHKNCVSRLQVVDGKIFSCSYDRTLRIWDAESGQELKRLDHDGLVLSLQARDGRIYSTSNDNKIRTWDFNP